MLCVRRGSGGLVHYELLSAGHTVDAGLYCCQSTTTMEKVRELSGRTTSRFQPFLLHDNAQTTPQSHPQFVWLPGCTETLFIPQSLTPLTFILSGPYKPSFETKKIENKEEGHFFQKALLFIIEETIPSFKKWAEAININ